ncbi:50S ribosomal protein L18 [Thermoanaerobacterium sp. PSU-2]|uniref:50S ribosomal protein L18 n=1 Tax=Thermoanaerobacterium sp. PSU-2 TaxID=1930849 RepID=UPI000A14DA7B|nr:50S ribosomal protein L18 [Thermoanaerobacterium sp. PSU-2]ORX22290.1 50S ribosomal protein L18 [Thermoanaerobacterium sp. PSU-2]
MISKIDRQMTRKRRHLRVRKKISGTSERPRLSVYKSLSHIYAQLIDDVNGVTLAHASTLDPELKSVAKGANKESAKLVGKLIAKKALEKGIKDVVFDRGGYVYHGVVRELADAAREGGLNF